MTRPLLTFKILLLASILSLGAFALSGAGPAPQPVVAPQPEFTKDVRPILAKYCLDCHSTKAMTGSLDLDRFDTVEGVRRHAKVWQQVAELVEAGEMTPKGRPQMSPGDKRDLLA